MEQQLTTTPAIRKTMRPTAVAGQFFPGLAEELRHTVDQLLRKAQRSGSADTAVIPKALIVPHAGYRFSGEIAAAGYITLAKAAKRISRVVLIGPAHKVRMQGIALTGADFFDSPLGRIPVDVHTVRQSVSRFPFACIHNKAHQHEHALETQLPFLQRIIGKFSLVPIVVGATEPAEVAQYLSWIWGGDETLILISSDLSHFKPYDAAREIDSFTSHSIRTLNPDPLTFEHACGQLGVRGLLSVARDKKLAVKQLDVRNSGDTADRKDQVVGYGSFAFYSQINRFNDEHRQQLGRIAKTSISNGLQTGKPSEVKFADDNNVLLETGASFVTLHSANRKLRGCIGSLSSQVPLAQNVSQNAFKSAFNDARFKPLTADEFAQIAMEISVLGPWQKIAGTTELEIIAQLHPFVDGLIFVEGSRRGTFLPSVWKSINDPERFLRQLKRKAGFTEDYWSDRVEVFRYTTETWVV